MKYQHKSISLLRFAYFILIANATLPLFDYYCPFYITLIPIFIVLYDMLKNYFQSLVKALLVLAVGMILYIVFIKVISFTIIDISDYLIIWLPCLIAIRLRKTDDKNNTLFVLKTTALLSIITCITSIIGYSVYPFASRELASSTNYDLYTKANIAGYNHIYAFILLIPVLWYLAENEKKKRIKLLYVIGIIITVLCIYESQYTLAIVITFIALVALMLNINQKRSVLFLGSAAIVLLFFKNGLVTAIRKLSDLIKYEYVKDRLLQLAMFIQTGTAFSNDYVNVERFEKYTDCIEHFVIHPISGSIFNDEPVFITGHTAILDVMSATGILGLIIYIGFFCIMFRIIAGSFFATKKKYIVVIIFAFFAISTFNPNHQALIIFILFIGSTCISILETDKTQKQEQEQEQNKIK